MGFYRKLVLLAVIAFAFCAPGQEVPSRVGDDLLERVLQPRFDDLPTLRQTRVIRVLVSYSHTNFFIHKGQQRGFEYEMLSRFADHLNEGITREDRKAQLLFIPVAFDQLLPMLENGLGDIAAAGLTITEERRKRIDFVDPYLKNVDEIIVSSRFAPEIRSIESLSGKKVYVSLDSSYQTHLEKQNATLVARGLPKIEIENLDPQFKSEDYLELADSGIIEYTVADDYLAEIWAGILENIRLYPDVEVNRGNEIAWAVRKDAPLLREELDLFVAGTKKGTLLGNIFFKRHYENTDWITNPLTEGEERKLRQYEAYVRKYAERYGFNWLKLAAQAFQESRLDQNARSAAGAVGIMQLLPSTAADLGLDPYDAEQNIHGGARYMAQIVERLESRDAMDEATQFDFALASYNAGPARVSQWRKKAAAQGLDPNVWFNNVEYIAARETVRYVGNVNKYYVAYRMSQRSDMDVRSRMDRLIGK
ncbi:MAG: transporter substrate-binding domain-containing protein [Verrucomicrobiota bacterium]